MQVAVTTMFTPTHLINQFSLFARKRIISVKTVPNTFDIMESTSIVFRSNVLPKNTRILIWPKIET